VWYWFVVVVLVLYWYCIGLVCGGIGLWLVPVLVCGGKETATSNVDENSLCR
jgi:hypothetical protein